MCFEGFVQFGLAVEVVAHAYRLSSALFTTAILAV